MAWRPQPRQINLDGTDAVLLSQDDYDRLDTIRRQAGAQASRIHALREQLADATAALDAIRQAACRADHAPSADEHVLPSVREEVLAILASNTALSRHPRRSEPGAQREQDQIS
jgi:hypothetical protein